MITAMLIDDEVPALTLLEHYLNLTDEITVVGKYSDPLEGIRAVAAKKPQAVFLDVDMPEIKGTEAASRIMEQSPDTIIVFVTAYSEYAVKAYELSALDYLLKPVSKERLDKTIARIKQSIVPERVSANRRLKINCFGGFSIAWSGEKPINWRSKKTQELAAFLIHNRGKTIGSEVLIDTVWPDADQESGSHLMRNAVYYIRRALINYGITEKEISIKDRYRLIVEDADIDTDIFKRHYDNLQPYSPLQSFIECADEYSGDYFGENGWLWAAQKKTALLENYLRVVSQVAGLLMQQNGYAQAEAYLLKVLGEEPYEERIILQLLDLYGHTGEHTKAARLYKNYSQTLAIELGCSPSEEITKRVRGN
jgi:two-component SAPR family response regulator